MPEWVFGRGYIQYTCGFVEYSSDQKQPFVACVPLLAAPLNDEHLKSILALQLKSRAAAKASPAAAREEDHGDNQPEPSINGTLDYQSHHSVGSGGKALYRCYRKLAKKKVVVVEGSLIGFSGSRCFRLGARSFWVLSACPSEK